MEAKTAQLRVRPRNAITAYGGHGTIFYETPTRARFLIDAGLAELVNAPPARAAVGPTETKPAGPSETKPAEPSEKKTTVNPMEPWPFPPSSDVAPAGPSIDSAPSSEDGPEDAASLSAEALRSPSRIAPPSRGRGRPRSRG